MRRSLMVLLAALVLAHGSFGVAHAHAVEEGGEVSHTCLVCEISADETTPLAHAVAIGPSTDAPEWLGRDAALRVAERATAAGPRAPPVLLSR